MTFLYWAAVVLTHVLRPNLWKKLLRQKEGEQTEGGRQSLAARLRSGQLAATAQTQWLHSSDNGWTPGAGKETRPRGVIIKFISVSNKGCSIIDP